MQKKSSCFTTRRINYKKNIPMNKPHTKIRNFSEGTKILSNKLQKKILPVSLREGSNES